MTDLTLILCSTIVYSICTVSSKTYHIYGLTLSYHGMLSQQE